MSADLSVHQHRTNRVVLAAARRGPGRLGDIGEEQEEIELEPLPEHEPVHEPSPAVPEKVPA